MKTAIILVVGLFILSAIYFAYVWSVLRTYDERMESCLGEMDGILASRVVGLSSVADMILTNGRSDEFNKHLTRASSVTAKYGDVDRASAEKYLDKAKAILDKADRLQHNVIYELFQTTWHTQQDRLYKLRTKYRTAEREYNAYIANPFHSFVATVYLNAA